MNQCDAFFKSVRLVFQDEGRFGRICETRRCWAPRGIRPCTLRQIVREYTHVFAALSPHDGHLDTLILPTADTRMMSLFLAEVSRRHRDELVLIVLDGAGWHRANDLLIPGNIRLLSLPPYSPELNPVEHIWDEIREKWFANRAFDSLEAVEDQLQHALHNLEFHAQRIKSLAGFPWIVNIPLNAT